MPIEPVTPPEESDTPPKRERPKRTAPGSAKLREQLTELYVTIGAVAVTPIDRLGGALLVKQAPELADEWVRLAETNPAIKKALQKLVEAGGWGGLILAHGMILLPVMANRGMLPDNVAHGAAFMTVAQHPDVGPLFTHPRFATAQQAPVQSGTENGDGSL